MVDFRACYILIKYFKQKNKKIKIIDEIMIQIWPFTDFWPSKEDKPFKYWLEYDGIQHLPLIDHAFYD